MIINGIDQSISILLNDKLSSPEVGKDNDMLPMADTITDIIDKNSSDSRTVSLWTLYLRLTHLLRLMIFAERITPTTSLHDWFRHHICVF